MRKANVVILAVMSCLTMCGESVYGQSATGMRHLDETGVSGISLCAGDARCPSAEFVMRLTVSLGRWYDVGETPEGYRRVIPITGGTFEGPKLRGEIMKGGADWQLIRGYRTSLEAIYSIKTEDGVYIHIRNKGVAYDGPDENGESSSYLMASPQFEAPAGSRYDWMNNCVFICSLDPSHVKDSIVLNIWKIK